MIGDAFDFLDACGVVRGEALGQLQQELFGRYGEARHFGEAGVR